MADLIFAFGQAVSVLGVGYGAYLCRNGGRFARRRSRSVPPATDALAASR